MGDLIDRQAAINALIYKMRPHNNGDGTMTICVMSEELVRETLNDLSSAKPHWIPCSKWLPSDYGFDWVLAQIQEDNGYIWIPRVMEYRKAKDDWYSDTEHLGWLKDHNGAFKVVAWMPLPEPYREVEE